MVTNVDKERAVVRVRHFPVVAFAMELSDGVVSLGPLIVTRGSHGVVHLAVLSLREALGESNGKAVCIDIAFCEVLPSFTGRDDRCVLGG